jgi:hypothetical protein
MKQADDPTYEIGSLQRAVAICINLDTSNRTADSYQGSSSGNAGDKKSEPKKCKYHPESKSHTTAECKTKPNAQASGQSSPAGFSSSTPSSEPAKKNLDHIQCNKCKNYGHYANNCSNKKSQPTAENPAPFSARPASWSTSTSSSTTATPAGPSKAVATTSTTKQSTATVRAADVDDSDEDSSPTVRSATLDRTLPASVVVPKYSVLLVVKGRVFNTLLDTGALLSFMDASLAQELELNVNPIPGAIKLAKAGSTTSRIGETDSVDVEVLFPGPHLKLKSRSLSVKFEVMDLNTDEYHFIIGSDLIHVLFPTSIPTEFVPPPRGSNAGAMALSVSLVSIAAADYSDIILTSEQNVIDGLSELRRNVHDAGAGDVPPAEKPDKMELFTSPELEAEYATNRVVLTNDSDIQEALRINSEITGFCNLPESVVKLEVDPAKRDNLYRKQYKIPYSLIHLADDVIKRWLKDGKICLAPPNCQYNNPLTIAPKKDDIGKLTGIRVCLDPRALNAALIANDRFQIPHIREALEIFGGNSLFGEFDLSEAYLQFELHPDSRPFTAFTWGNTQYMFIGAPFGLSLLPGHFQRNMSFMFSDMKFTFPYLDNLPFGSSTWEEHRDHALMIIHRCNQANLKIKPSSVKFGQSHLKCLGHLLSTAGVGIDPEKLSVLKEWSRPKTGLQLQTFLGFVGFLRQHVRHFSDLTGPLESVKNQKEIEWTPQLVNCFEMTKEAIARAPFLQFPDFSLPFHIATDASNDGVGGVLYQPRKPDEGITATNIVSICSKKLGPSERNYSAYKKELFGVIYCLRQFHSYVWGRKDLTIFTDHKPLIYMLTSKELSTTLKQWMDVIVDYQFTIQHRPGVLNVIPDTLSRMFSAAYPEVWGVAPANITFSSNLIGEGNATASASTPADFEPISVSSADILAVEMEKRGKTIPSSDAEKIELIKKAHLFGHFGRESIFKSLLAQGYWWPHLREQIQTELASCDPCTRFTVTKSGYNPSQYITADGPWTHIQIDTSVHLPKSPDGYTALLVVIDVFTGFVLLRPIKTTSADLVAKELWDIFSTFGLPKIMQSDNGPEFVNDIIRALVKLTGIDHRLISPYNPRSDGKVERCIGTVMSIIKKLLHGTTTYWPLFVPFAQLSFNHKIATLTGSSPFSLMFGRELNEMKDYTADTIQLISLDDWKTHQEKLLSVIFPAISDKVRISKSKMVQQLNKYRKVLVHNAIPSGAVVMMKDPVRENKFQPKYLGPYTVMRRTRNGNYVLRDATGSDLDRHVPPDQLKLVSRKARDSDLKDNVYEVERIEQHRGTPGAYEYYTKWKNYHERSWEPQSSFLDDTIIKDYWKGQSQSSSSSS